MELQQRTVLHVSHNLLSKKIPNFVFAKNDLALMCLQPMNVFHAVRYPGSLATDAKAPLL